MNELVPPEDVELGLFDPSPAELPTEERIERARRAEAVALATPGIVNSQGGSWGQSEGRVVLANTLGFSGGYRSSSVSLSVVPQAEKDGQMERDYWYTTGRGLSDLQSPEEVGRIAAERTLRRLGARQVKTAEVPVVFDPDTAAELLGTLFSAMSGYSVFRSATFLRDQLGQQVAPAGAEGGGAGGRDRRLSFRPASASVDPSGVTPPRPGRAPAASPRRGRDRLSREHRADGQERSATTEHRSSAHKGRGGRGDAAPVGREGHRGLDRLGVLVGIARAQSRAARLWSPAGHCPWLASPVAWPPHDL